MPNLKIIEKIVHDLSTIEDKAFSKRWKKMDKKKWADIIYEVEKLRESWKPKSIKVLLVAESFVFTARNEFEKDNDEKLVKFIYCLEYNRTSNFWKLFCNSLPKKEKEKYSTIAKNVKLRKKVLKRMKRRGIWLIDASLFPINNIKRPNNRLNNKTKKQIMDKSLVYIKNNLRKSRLKIKKVFFFGDSVRLNFSEGIWEIARLCKNAKPYFFNMPPGVKNETKHVYYKKFNSILYPKSGNHT